jgi:hypothetical protein
VVAKYPPRRDRNGGEASAQATRGQSIRQGQCGKAFTSRGHHTHGRAQATMAAKHPLGPTRQSIRGQGASHARWSPSDNGGKASASRGASCARRSPSDDCGNTKHPNRADQSEDKTKAHAGTTQVATTPARDGRPQARPTYMTVATNCWQAAHVGKTSAIGVGHNHGSRKGGGRCSNGAFRKEMTPVDANFVETATQRNLHSQNLPRQPPPTKRARDDASKKVMMLARHHRQSKVRCLGGFTMSAIGRSCPQRKVGHRH